MPQQGVRSGLAASKKYKNSFPKPPTAHLLFIATTVSRPSGLRDSENQAPCRCARHRWDLWSWWKAVTTGGYEYNFEKVYR